jgi:hypothetical protein
MQQNVCYMVAGGFVAEKLAIEHVRYPCQWMPVVCVAGGEGPLYLLPVQAASNDAIPCNVEGVIKIDETAAVNLPIGNKSG